MLHEYASDINTPAPDYYAKVFRGEVKRLYEMKLSGADWAVLMIFRTACACQDVTRISNAYLSQATGVSLKQVEKSVSSLRGLGLIVTENVTETTVKGSYVTHRRSFVVDAREASPTLKAEGGVPSKSLHTYPPSGGNPTLQVEGQIRNKKEKKEGGGETHARTREEQSEILPDAPAAASHEEKIQLSRIFSRWSRVHRDDRPLTDQECRDAIEDHLFCFDSGVKYGHPWFETMNIMSLRAKFALADRNCQEIT